MVFGSMIDSIFGIVAVVCAVWVIYDVFTKNKKLKQNMKIVWTVLAILFNIITAIVYYFMYKK